MSKRTCPSQRQQIDPPPRVRYKVAVSGPQSWKDGRTGTEAAPRPSTGCCKRTPKLAFRRCGPQHLKATRRSSQRSSRSPSLRGAKTRHPASGDAAALPGPSHRLRLRRLPFTCPVQLRPRQLPERAQKRRRKSKQLTASTQSENK